MNILGNARLTPVRREKMAQAVLSGRLSQAQAAREFGVCAPNVEPDSAIHAVPPRRKPGGEGIEATRSPMPGV